MRVVYACVADGLSFFSFVATMNPNPGAPNPNNAPPGNSAAQDTTNLAYVSLRKEKTSDVKFNLTGARATYAHMAKNTANPKLRTELRKLDEKCTSAIGALEELANAERQCLQNMTVKNSTPMDAYTIVSHVPSSAPDPISASTAGPPVVPPSAQSFRCLGGGASPCLLINWCRAHRCNAYPRARSFCSVCRPGGASHCLWICWRHNAYSSGLTTIAKQGGGTSP
jgi:hypothetical protein